MDGSRHLSVSSLRPVTFLGFGLLVFSIAGSVRAAAPQVHFDVPLVISCADVTTDEFAARHPQQRLLEATFEISSLVAQRSEEDLVEYIYRFVSPRTSVRVVDYQPRTTLASDYAGGINIEKKHEKTRSAGLAVNGAWDHLVTANGNSSLGSKRTESERYELVAPMDAVTASGTLLHSQGVYFKLRKTRQLNLEGSKVFTIIFSAPRDWQGSLLLIDCRALGYDRGVVRQLDELIECGRSQQRVVLVGVGDQLSYQIGEEFVRAERRLRQLAAASRDDVHRINYPTVLHELGGLLDVVKPKVADAWLEQLLRHPQQAAEQQLHRRLPPDLRTAAENYLAAHRRFDQLVR